MQQRKPYCDLGLVIAVGVFICVAIKCLLFGFTWINVIWLLMACGYFYLSWKLKSDDARLKHSTTAFLILSLVAMASSALLDQNKRPVMHAFEGMGDTIVDRVIREEVIEEVPVAPLDTTKLDSLSADSLLSEGEETEVPSEEISGATVNDSTVNAE